MVNAVLTAGYDDLEAVLVRLVEETNLTTLQILDGWHKSRSCTVNGINHWNHYTKYAMRHEEQERRRLGLPTDVPRKSQLFPSQLCICTTSEYLPVTPSVRCELYAKFKQDNPETWQEILEVHDMVERVQSSPQTIAQRAQTFNKVKKRVISIVRTSIITDVKP